MQLAAEGIRHDTASKKHRTAGRLYIEIPGLKNVRNLGDLTFQQVQRWRKKELSNLNRLSTRRDAQVVLYYIMKACGFKPRCTWGENHKKIPPLTIARRAAYAQLIWGGEGYWGLKCFYDLNREDLKPFTYPEP